MKIIFMGTPDFAVSTLEEIINAGHDVAAVVTQPDKPKGRGGAFAMSPVKETALKHDLCVLQPEKCSNDEFIETLSSYNPDVIVVVAFGQKLPKSIIDMPKYGCINVHASLLPKYRGASPIQWAVIDGCEYSGVTTMMMDEGLDTGDMLLTKKVKLDDKETGGSLFEKLSSVGAELLVETLEKVERGDIERIKQDDTQATYVKMLSKSFGKIDFSKSAVSVERLVRALNPWPSAYTSIGGKMLKIWDADVCSQDSQRLCDLTDVSMAPSGSVVKVTDKAFFVKCGEDLLEVTQLQLEGKKRMKTEDFLRGYHLEKGVLLG